MSELLYKVSEPRSDLTFQPRQFWRAEDWSLSDDRPRDELIEDRILYAATFDELSIHLLPKVWRLRVRLDNEERCERLKALAFSWAPSARAVIFAAEDDRRTIEAFSPTIFAFERSGFEQTPTNEFVSREPQTAVSAETVTMEEASRRWRFDVIYVPDVSSLSEALRSRGVDHEMQT